MKKFFVYFALFIAALFVVSCGGDSGSGGSYGYVECSYGSYRCMYGDSYFCGYANGSNDLTWQPSERCSYSCDDYTGKCSSNSGGGNSSESGSSGGNSSESGSSSGNSSESSPECRNGKYQCNGNYSYYCENEHWSYDEDCGELGCDSGTGVCNKGECSSGEYMCNGDWSCSCNAGHWGNDEETCDWCVDGCNASTGKCVADTSKCSSIGGKMWSEVFIDSYWEDAVAGCKALSQCGYNDWHLPTISELRILSSCGLTSVSGSCGVKDSCLSSSCSNQACVGCDGGVDPNGYNKLGYASIFWSSSTVSDQASNAWIMNFNGRGLVGSLSKYSELWTSCVR